MSWIRRRLTSSYNASARTLEEGDAMSGPFIFIATNRLKPGKLDDERARVPALVDFIEANEPR